MKIHPFQTHIRWVESEVMSTIEDKLNWKRNPNILSSARGDCDIAILRSYLYKKTLGFNDKDCELSAMIRDNQISREEAFERLDFEGNVSEDLIKQIFYDLRLDYSDLYESLKYNFLLEFLHTSNFAN